MNDKDKGTYSPPTEDHLSYETRKAPARDQAPITLIISGICLVLLLLAVVLFYNSGLNNHGRTPPDVGDSVDNIKDGKVEDAKPLTGDQDLNDGDATSAHFAPTTEAPGDRADASVATVDQAPPPVAPIQGPLPSQANNAAIPGTAAASAASSPVAKPAPTLALKGAVPSTGGAASSSSASKATQLAVAKPEPKPVTKPEIKPEAAKVLADAKPADAKPVGGGAVVQIGAFESQDIANKQYASIASSYGLFLGGTGKRIEKVDTDKGARFRTQFTGFATPDKAKAFCSALKAAGHDCFVK